MILKARKTFWICPFTWICTESYWELFWAETHPPFKFSRKSVQQFLYNPTDKPTNQQMDTSENVISLQEVQVVSIIHSLSKTNASTGQTKMFASLL